MQKHFDKAQCKQKGVSTLILIIVIIVVALVAVGGVFAYQYFSTKPQPIVQTQQNQNQQQQTVNQQTNNVQPTDQTAQPSITVTSPNGGETWIQGSTHTINWITSNISSSDKVNISVVSYNSGYYATDINHPSFFVLTGPVAGGGNLSASGVPANSGSYTWTVASASGKDPFPFKPGNYFKIQISDPNVLDKNNVAIQGVSSNYFSIVAPTNQTAGWKTYTNTQYGFEFQYPKEWVVSDSGVGPTVSIWSSENKKQEAINAIIPIYPEFSVNYNSTNSFKDFAKGLLGRDVSGVKDFVSSYGGFGSYAETNIGGTKAYAVISVANRAVYTIYIEYGNGVYVLSAEDSSQTGFDPKNPKLDPNVSKIISTFKFTK